jgi:hypothetical protein
MPPVNPTLVTVPVVGVVQVMAVAPPAWDVRTCPAEPTVIGRLKLYVPAADCPSMLITPLVVPASAKVPFPPPTTPTVRMFVPLVVRNVAVLGAAAAPPPSTGALEVSNADVAHVLALEK